MAKVLVTGGAGFIGSHVAEELVRQGHETTILDDLSMGKAKNAPAGSWLVHGSTLDSYLLARLFMTGKYEHVFHFAAYAAEVESHTRRAFTYENNVVGAARVIDEARRAGTRCIIFASSAAVYGNVENLPATEETPTRPVDPYGIAKLATELDLDAARQAFGLHYVIFRLHNVYGERQNMDDPTRNAAAIFLRQALAGKAMTIYGDGEQRRAFTYAGDIAPLMAGAIGREETWDEAYNLGSDEPCSVLALAQAAARAAGTEMRIRWLDERREVRNIYSAHAKARQFFGQWPETGLDEGLQRTVEWARRNGWEAMTREEATKLC